MRSIVDRISIIASALTDDPRDAVRSARELGFGGLLFDAYSPALDFVALSASGRREILRILANQGRQLVGLRTRTGAKGLGPGADLDAVLSRISLAIQAAADVLSPLLCVELGPLPRYPADVAVKKPIATDLLGAIIIPTLDAAEAEPPAPISAADRAFASQLESALRELGERADRYSVTVAFRSELGSFASLARALAAANCPWFGVDLDPVAVLQDDWPMDEVLSRFAERIAHVRARDAIAGGDRRIAPTVIGKGHVDWATLLSELDGAGYRGWITIDPQELPDRRGAAIAGLAYLREVSR